MSTTVHGTGTTLHVTGDINATHISAPSPAVLAFSTGVLLRAAYTTERGWRFTPLAIGHNPFAISSSEGSDRVVVDDAEWVVCGGFYAAH